MAKLSAGERQEQITELLKSNGTMKVTELAKYFGVSRETIRKDLITLDDSGAVEKWFGRAVPVHNFNVSPIEKRLHANEQQKIEICQKAFDYIPEDAILYIDTGSTPLWMAKLLSQRAGFRIITASLPAVNELMGSGNEIIMTGGTMNPTISGAVGVQPVKFLERLKFDVALLGTAGFSRHAGPTTNTFDDADIKKVVIENSQTNIVLSDSRKTTYSSLVCYADWEEIDYLITDSGMDQEVVRELSEHTEVIQVEQAGRVSP